MSRYNIVKIQQDLIKELSKNAHKVRYQFFEDNVYFTMNAYNVYVIPCTEFFVSFPIKCQTNMFSEFLKIGYHENYDTPNSFIRENDKYLADFGNELYYDEKLIHSYGDARYRIMENKMLAVFSPNTDELRGFICNVRRNK